MSNPTDYEYIRFDRHHFDADVSVLEVTIDRPGEGHGASLNAVDGRLHHELTALFADLRNERDARAILLTGSGAAFSAGGDFDWFPSLSHRPTLEALHRDARHLIYDLLDVPAPIVCALNGSAMGLGASIALLCDVIFAARSAQIGDPHVRVGIAAGDGGTVAWPLAIGPARAKQYLLTGDPIDAIEAERIGLVNKVCDDETCREEALAFAHRLAAGAPLAVQYTKAAINASIKAEMARSFEQAVSLEIATFGTTDHAEALSAIADRRPPRFTGS